MSKLLRYPAREGSGDSDFELEGDLAKSWETPDPQTITFTLRENVKWQNKTPLDGRALTADDVKFTFERFMSVTENPQHYFFEDVDSFSAPSPETFQLTLKRPSAVVLDNLATAWTWVLAPEVEDKFGDFTSAESVVGTGPWMLDRYQPNAQARYVRNPDYYDADNTYIEEIQTIIMPDSASQLTAFIGGQLDVFTPRREHLSQIQSSRRDAVVQDVQSLTGFYLYMNSQKPPFNDKRVRQALSLALDRKLFIKAFNQDKGVVGTPVPASLTQWYLDYEQAGDASRFFTPDLTEAKQLLDAAGHSDGFETTMIGYAYSDAYVEQAEWAVSALKEIGVDVNLQLLEYPAYLAAAYGGDLQGMGWEPSTPYTTIDDYIYGPYYTDAPKNQSRVADPALDDLVEKQRRLLDDEERVAAIHDVQRYVYDAQYMLHLSYPINARVLQANVHGAFPKNGYDTGTTYRTAWLSQ